MIICGPTFSKARVESHVDGGPQVAQNLVELMSLVVTKIVKKIN